MHGQDIVLRQGLPDLPPYIKQAQQGCTRQAAAHLLCRCPARSPYRAASPQAGGRPEMPVGARH